MGAEGLSVAITVEALGDRLKGEWIGGDVPERLTKCPVPEVAGKEEEMMGDGRLLPAPLGDQPRDQGVAEIVKSRIRPRSGDDEIPSDAAKRVIHGVLVQGAATAAGEEPIGKYGMAATRRPVATECSYRGGMQGQQPSRAELCARDAQGAGCVVEIGLRQTQGFAHAHARTGDQTDQCNIR